MYYFPYGPFALPDFRKPLDRYWRRDFWLEANKVEDGLSEANGVYIFSLRHGEQYTPWYVGMTCSAAGFAGEVFQKSKVNTYAAVQKERKGAPMLHLIAKVEENRANFCRYSARSQSQIDRLETYLIGMGLTQNPGLMNDKKTSFHRNLQLYGVLGPRYPGKPAHAARTLRDALGLEAA